MSYAGLEALAGKGGTSPAKASSPVFIIHYFIIKKLSLWKKLSFLVDCYFLDSRMLSDSLTLLMAVR
jgi:hypothetical protein